MLRTHSRRGLTLLELIVVMAVLVALATMVVPILDNFAGESRMTATQQTLRRLQDIINNRYATDMKGFVFIDASSGTAVPQLDPSGMSLNKGLPVPNPVADISGGRNLYYPQLAFLFFDPTTSTQMTTATSGYLGWRGPYSSAGGAVFPSPTQTMPNGQSAQSNGFYPGGTAVYGYTASSASTSTTSGWIDPAVIDAWGSPIVIQRLIPNITSTISSPFNYTVTLSAADYGPPSTLSGSYLTLTNSALVSAGPDGILNSIDDVFIKIQ